MLKESFAENELDANFPQGFLNEARDFIIRDPNTINCAGLQSPVEALKKQWGLLLNDSPYPEVCAVVDRVDDPSISASAFRPWSNDLFLTVVFASVNQIFTLHYPAINIPSLASQVVSYLMGMFLATVLPTRKFITFGGSFSLNQGPFNQKEHMLITAMANVAYGGFLDTVYVTNIYTVLKVPRWFNMAELYDKAGFQILLALSTQLLEYGCAGLARRFLVYPSTLIYPKALAIIALSKALRNDNKLSTVHGRMMTRYRLFLYSFLLMFVYYWFPVISSRLYPHSTG
jgi:OPT family oligopeptide transporter